ncbi:cysteine dioxygenase type i [Fusarium sporotrichioides]|uniref:cysteine dioxygenase n=1 Tax=Fusarium sporotrichioides TaxID=5514 RepID=A0A395S1L3_FUSSP|nr:cysteine dioxygenase type i [Fusarium sporotrichioides]
MADPSHFSDIFWEPPKALVAAQPDPASPKNGEVLLTTFYSLERSTVGIDFLVPGLGTIAAKPHPPEMNLTFTIRPTHPETQPTLTLKITKSDCVLSKREKDSEKDVPFEELLSFRGDKERSTYVNKVMFPKGKLSALLNPLMTDKTAYWISVDRSNARIRYGKYLINNSMTFMEIQFVKQDAVWMENLSSTEVDRDGSVVSNKDIKFRASPITVDLPPLIVPEDEITLEQLESSTAMTFVNLPEGCQKLYHNICGPNITVQPASFPQLPEAIDQSCKNPDKICGKILQNKDTFGDPRETYLRITLGDNLANSPGIPYVMEIWPPGHMSPIHQHGDASAIIRVLYGSINVTWFDALQENGNPQVIGQPVNLKKGDVTWLGEDQYQIHQLRNMSKTVCITLQCYQFEKHDTVHDESFHWMDSKRHIERFIPNSDMAYGQFVQAMKAEWEAPN